MADENKFLDKQGLATLWSLIKAKLANLADNKSTIYLTDDEHLTLKGYDDAKQGQMLVKDVKSGITWIDPPDETQIQAAVAEAKAARDEAKSSASTAEAQATKAETAANVADIINTKTVNMINDKFWWGSLEEYNALTEIKEGTIYFIQV